MTILPVPSGGNLSSLLQQYAALTAEDTKKELLRLLDLLREEKTDDYHGCYDAVSYLAWKLGYLSPEDIQDILKKKEYSPFENLAANLMCGWAQRDFQSAMDYLLKHKREMSQVPDIFEKMIQVQTKKDADQLLQWLPSLSAGERGPALETIACDLPKYHPEKLPDFAAMLTDKDLKFTALGGELATTWALTDWGSLNAWANTLNKDNRRRVIESGLPAWEKMI